MAIIGVTFPVLDQLDYLDEALTSLEAIMLDSEHDLALVVVDNGSKGDVVEVVERHKWLIENCQVGFIYHRKNEGVGRAWNEGIEACMALGADAIAVCNTDIVFGPMVLDHCYEALGLGAFDLVFPATYRQGGPMPLDFCAHATEAAQRPVDGDSCVITGGFAGWCFMVSTECIQTHGLFDAEYRFWYQDTDYHHRLVSAARPPAEIQACCVHHYESKTIKSLPGAFSYKGDDATSWRSQDQQRFEQKWRQPKT